MKFWKIIEKFFILSRQIDFTNKESVKYVKSCYMFSFLFICYDLMQFLLTSLKNWLKVKKNRKKRRAFHSYWHSKENWAQIHFSEFKKKSVLWINIKFIWKKINQRTFFLSRITILWLKNEKNEKPYSLHASDKITWKEKKLRPNWRWRNQNFVLKNTYTNWFVCLCEWAESM